MNASFFAGAGDVIECFVRELGILQASLKAEEVRAARDETEAEVSILWVTKTALAVTRQRFALERAAKKSLQRDLTSAKTEVCQEMVKFRALSDRSSVREAELEQEIAKLRAALHERDEELLLVRRSFGIYNLFLTDYKIKNDLSKAHQDTMKVQAKLAKTKLRLDEQTRRTQVAKEECAAAAVHLEDDKNPAAGPDITRARLETREAEIKCVRAELGQVHARIAARDQELRLTSKRLRMAQRDAVGARSMMAMMRTRYATSKRSNIALKDKLKIEKASHEELKLTCRQLIVIVEAAEAGASAETVEHSHSHGTSECKYQKKYMKAKAKNGKLEMKLAALNAEHESPLGSGSKKRKMEDGMEPQKNPRRIRYSQ
ncbi:hypothetical protein B0H13DRAFT_2672135 [Mycena leptocephala]|nr:hypothetical protein B0H13DRAFT_2672135 [Mycena leptocephala]